MLSPTASLVLVVAGLACTLVPALVALGFASHHLRVLLRLRRVARATRLDRAGPVALEGRVVAEAGDTEPVTIVLGRQSITGAHASVSLSREIVERATFRPFRLALADGEEVHVEPDPATRVCADALPAAAANGGRHADETPVRVVSIREGDTIQVVGALRASVNPRPRSSAFRGPVAGGGQDGEPLPRSLVVRRHPLEPLLLSKRKLARERLPSLVLHALAALLFTALGLALHLDVLAPFYRLAVDGRPMWGSVHKILGPSGQPEQFPSAGDTLLVAVELGRGRATLESEPIDAALASQVLSARREGRPLHVAVLVAASRGKKPQMCLGPRPRCPVDAVPVVLVSALLAAGYALAAGRLRPRLVGERVAPRPLGELAAPLPKGA